MGQRSPESLLPSIALLLKEAGALGRTAAVDTATLARQPVFTSDKWRESIAEFLRWSGTTLSPVGEGSLFELVLGHGRVGALAIYNAFREYLRDRAGSLEAARAKLEAVRIIPSMAAHWLRLIDWDLEDAERLEAEDLRAGSQGLVRLPAELSDRLKKVVAKELGLANPSDLVEKAVEDKLQESETETPQRPRTGNGPSFSMGRIIRDLWRDEIKEPDDDPSVPPSRRRPPRQEV
ncbi:MAG TPA: hypothetical protein VNC59_04400 [Thermoanaerobaculia bacterium]|nr:hypothetical protein [Thermoanaerobaculia bacterium]